jgi:hypothetical protein
MSCAWRNCVGRLSLALVAAVAAIGAFAPPVAAVLLVHEPFDYPAGQTIVDKNGGLGFTGAWRNETAATPGIIQAGSINYPGLPTTGNSLFMTGATGNYSVFRNFTLIPGTNGTTTWLSFLGQRLGAASATANPYPRGVNVSFYSTPGQIARGQDPNGSTAREQFAIGNSSGAPTNDWAFIGRGQIGNIVPSTMPPVPYGGAPPAFFVLRIDHKGAANPAAESAANGDDIYFWINPSLVTEPSIATANGQRLGTEGAFLDHAGIDYVRPFVGNVGNGGSFGELLMDELRIGTAYGDVTGISPVLPGDTDEDGIPGEYPDDFAPIRNNFRTATAARMSGDLVDDNVIDFKDYRQWKTAFAGAGGDLESIDWEYAAVPEPAAGFMGAVVFCALIRIRRRHTPSA